MNVFEDLVVELKEENLLEDTIIDRDALSSRDSYYPANGPRVAPLNLDQLLNVKSESSKSARPAQNTASAKNRLSDQLSTLQLVEFVISAAEKTSGKTSRHFDDLSVKKAFHRYGQAGSGPDSDEYFEAESTLISTLGDWEADLSKRDAAVQPGAVRSCAESANPPLSPQALFAMLRFYRGIPPSESTYTKFDFVVTRLFSKFVDGDKREVLCSREEIVKHLTQKYAAWGLDEFESLPPHDAKVLSMVSTFDNFNSEALHSSGLSELISSKFFERLLEFKRSNASMMFIPYVTAASIEANLGISSKVISLISAATESGALSRIAGLDKTVISDSLARSFSIDSSAAAEQHSPATPQDPKKSTTPIPQKKQRPEPVKRVKEKSRRSSGGGLMFGVNRWLLMATVLAVVASCGIYVWAEYFTSEPLPSSEVKVVEIDNAEIKPFIKTAKISGTMLYAVVVPTFEQMSEDQKRDLLTKIEQQGAQKGYDRVTIMNGQGKTIAYVTREKVELKVQ